MAHRHLRSTRINATVGLRAAMAVAVCLAVLGGCGMSREANDLADQLQDDPIIAEDLAIPGFSAGDTGRSEEMGTVIVDRTYSGPDRPLQTILQDRVEEAGWLAIGVRCRNDGRGFTLRARRAVDGHVALLTMTVYDEGDGRKIGIEVTSRLERRTYRDGDPKPIEQCE